MSLRPQPPLPPVPDNTARVARAAFRRGNPYVLLRDRLGAVFADADFADLYPALGQPAYAPWRLALVTLLQFREGLSSVHVQFRAADCRDCPSRARCTRSRSGHQGRVLTLLPRREHEALAAARAREGTAEGRRLYAQRQGVEATLSQGVRAFDLRQARYRGLAKTGLQHIATAAAINLDRIAAWFAGRPLAPTRTSRFAALAA